MRQVFDMQTDKPHVSRKNRFHSVAEMLQDWITKGLVAPGDRLPAERKLAKELKVSRTSIREAFLVLEQKDLVEIRRGTKGGAYVKTPSTYQLFDEMNLLLQVKNLSLDQIVEFRQTIEKNVTVLASQKADLHDISRLKYQLGLAKSYVGRGSGWDSDFIEADKKIHLCIAQISKNPLFAQALEATLGLGRYFDRFHKLPPCLMEKNYIDLYNIVEAIENHKPDIAGSLAQTHITRFNIAAV